MHLHQSRKKVPKTQNKGRRPSKNQRRKIPSAQAPSSDRAQKRWEWVARGGGLRGRKARQRGVKHRSAQCELANTCPLLFARSHSPPRAGAQQRSLHCGALAEKFYPHAKRSATGRASEAAGPFSALSRRDLTRWDHGLWPFRSPAPAHVALIPLTARHGAHSSADR